MYECSLYGMTTQLKHLHMILSYKNFIPQKIARIDTYLKSKDHKIILQSCSNSNFLIYKNEPDPTKTLKTIINKINRSEVLNCEDTISFLNLANFKQEKKLFLEGIEYVKDNIHIEVTIHSITNSEIIINEAFMENFIRNYMTNEIDNSLFNSCETFFVKIYTFAQTSEEGENLVFSESINLKKYINLQKPPVNFFKK
ncbi:hypothetical protein CWI37_2638p0010 [Hamiltosporidium tvaerminnensis]|uniref:Mediator of RNA polymerase II transcription subunit 18 n=1 Tax=Hamiltosporidium tvaerminnensis TaxID=1176355 RepID=A0A4Q9KR83_9MICR|nr:hypothetical protein CWI37_2638p0010 [Hamiltosporidium tvaerminnensis]